MKKFIRYNLSRIMCNAWKAFRLLASRGKTFSDCLRAAWAWERTHGFIVKGWFLAKLPYCDREAIELFDSWHIIRETEKAVLVEWFDRKYPMNSISKWVPKSCIEF